MACRLVPLPAGWADLDECESAADIEPGHAILVDPEFLIDPVLACDVVRRALSPEPEGG